MPLSLLMMMSQLPRHQQRSVQEQQSEKHDECHDVVVDVWPWRKRQYDGELVLTDHHPRVWIIEDRKPCASFQLRRQLHLRRPDRDTKLKKKEKKKKKPNRRPK